MFLWDELRALTCPILIYGMGNGADKLLTLCREYHISIAGIFSSDSHAREGTFQGCPVLSRSKALEQYPDAMILLAFGTERPDEVADILSLSQRHCLRIPDTPLLGGTILTPESVSLRRTEIQHVSALWADDQSRALFHSLLDAKLSGSPAALMANTSPRSELMTLLHLNSKESYLDLGAYRGDTIEEFLSLTHGSYRQITAMEPDAHNYKKLQAAWGNRDRVTPLPYASWNCRDTLEFTGKGGRNCSKKPDLPGKYAHLHPVSAIPVDELELDVSYVKMDVEGAEAETLQGMQETICRCRPKLLISAYHKPDDFITLPGLLLDICPDYRLYLRRTPCIPAWEIQICALPYSK